MALKNRESIQKQMDDIDKEVENERTDPAQRRLLKQRKMRRFYVFSILEVALICLSPILAITVWLLLSQLGLQGISQQNGTTQTGIFVMADG